MPVTVASAVLALRKRLLDPAFVKICSHPLVRNLLAPEWKDAPYQFVYSHTGAGLSPEDEAHRLRRMVRGQKASRMLFVGVQEGEELLPWLTSGAVKEVVAIDIEAFPSDWKRLRGIADAMRVKLAFVVCDAQRFPFAKLGCFDVIYSQGLLEHVIDVDSFLKGCAGMLKENGVCHAYFGPLWHSYGGSCHLGMLGYDHLVVPWAEYLRYARLVGDGWQYWAENGRFCRLSWQEIYSLWSEHFAIERLALLGARDTRWYKKTYPEKWKRLVALYPERELSFRLASVLGRRRGK